MQLDESSPSPSPSPSPEPATVHIDVDHGRTLAIARLAGDIDMAVKDEMFREIGDVLTTVQRIDLDLRDVTFMDSTGISLLVDLHQLARQHEVTLRCCNPTPALLRLFTICGLASIVQIEPGPD